MSRSNCRFTEDKKVYRRLRVRAKLTSHLYVPMHRSKRQNIKLKFLSAQTCLSHGLFVEAEAIYVDLLKQHHRHLNNELNNTPATQKAIRLRINYIQKQINIVRRRANSLECNGRSEKKLRVISQGASSKARDIKKLDDYAGQESRLREGLGDRYEALGTRMLDQGALHDGLHMFRQALEIITSDDSKARIYQKIGRVYENLNEVPAALMAYQEAANSFKRVEEQVNQRIKPLTKIIKQAKAHLFLSCKFPKMAFGATLLIALFFIAFVPKLQTVDNVDYFNLGDADAVYYKNFKQVFGNDEFFVIAYEAPDLFSPQSLATLRNLTMDLEDIDGLEAVNSLGNIDDIIGGADYFEVAPFLDDIPEDRESLLALKKQALTNRLYVDNLISKDGKKVAIVVEVHDRPNDQDYRKRIIGAVYEVLDRYKDRVGHFYLAGGTTTNLSLSQYLQEDMAVFVPITFALVILTMWFFFRNKILTALAFGNIGVCVGATVGLMGLTGVTLNNVTSIVVPLVMALALCDTVHIFAHLDRQILVKLHDKQAALSYVLTRVHLPCLLTSLTTGIGFLSLSVSQLEPIRELAWVASAAMLFEFVFSFFFLAPLLLLFPPEKIYRDRTQSNKFSQLLSHLGRCVEKYSKSMVTAGAIMVILAIMSAANLKVETNFLAFFKPSSPVRISLDWVSKQLSGVMTVDVALQSTRADAFKHPQNLQVIETIQNHINTIAGIDKTMSFNDFIKDMNKSFHAENESFYKIPDTLEAVSQYLLLYDSDDIEDFVNADFDRARISARLSEHSSSKNLVVINAIKAFVDQLPEHDLEIRVTGQAVDVQNVSTALVKSQIYSLALAAAVIAIVMGFVFRSIKLGAISLIPNLFPIIMNFGIMGIAGIPLDTGTALIAAIAMGIAVDDTIHFLSEYKSKRKRGMHRSKALRVATLIKGRAIISSSIILCIGFGVLILSRFVPIIHFGFLCSVIMITAIIGDFVVLPAVLLLKGKREPAADHLEEATE